GLAVLSNGNVVVNNPYDDFGGTNAGAVYLFDGLTGALISDLVGSSPGDFVGGYDYVDDFGEHTGAVSTVAVSNGNFLVISPSWHGNRGAVTWGSGTTGASGFVADANSLVGTSPDDAVGSHYSFTYSGEPPRRVGSVVVDVSPLSNGNYVVHSPSWNGTRGEATWGSGTAGVSGPVSAANSLVGTSPGDYVGSGFTPLSNGNYVVGSWLWNGNRG